MEERLAKREDIPRGAKILSRDDVFQKRYESVSKHKPWSDVFLLRFGGAAAGTLAAISGLVLLRHFRGRLSITKEAYLSSSLCCSFLPGFSAFMHHMLFVLPPILLEEQYCSVCLEMRSAGVQFLTGVALPGTLALITSAFTGYKIGLNVPYMSEPVAMIKMGNKLLQSGGGMQKLSALIFLNFFGSMLLVNAEAVQVVQFRKRTYARTVMSTE